MPAAPPLLRFAPAIFVVLWSTGFIAAKFAAPVSGPFSLLALRFFIVVPVLATAAKLLASHWPDRKTALHAMVSGALIHGLYLGGIFFAVKHGLPAGFAGLVVGLQPILTAFFAFGLVGETIRPAQWTGLGLGLAGVAMVFWPKLGGDLEISTLLIAIAAVACISLGTVYNKKYAAAVELVPGTALQFVGASVVVLPLAALEGFHYVPSWQLVFVVGWLVLVLSIGAVMLLLLMVRHGAVATVAALFYLVPPVTALFAWAFFDEALLPIQLAGTALVVVAVKLATGLGRRG